MLCRQGGSVAPMGSATRISRQEAAKLRSASAVTGIAEDARRPRFYSRLQTHRQRGLQTRPSLSGRPIGQVPREGDKC